MILHSLGFFCCFVFLIYLKWEPLYTTVPQTQYFMDACSSSVKLKILLLDRNAQFPSTFAKIFYFCSTDNKEEDILTLAVNKHIIVISGRDWAALLTEILLTAWHFRFLSWYKSIENLCVLGINICLLPLSSISDLLCLETFQRTTVFIKTLLFCYYLCLRFVSSLSHEGRKKS